MVPMIAPVWFFDPDGVDEGVSEGELVALEGPDVVLEPPVLVADPLNTDWTSALPGQVVDVEPPVVINLGVVAY